MKLYQSDKNHSDFCLSPITFLTYYSNESYFLLKLLLNNTIQITKATK